MALASIDDAAALTETRAALGGLCAARRAAPRAAAPPAAAPPRELAVLAAWADEGERPLRG